MNVGQRSYISRCFSSCSDSIMLRIDFGQSFLDHRSILVLVKKLGSIKEDEFSQLFEEISQLRTVELSTSRTVHLRYTRHISHQFVDWGSFHTHKKLLGILSIARYSPDKDLSSIKTAHESLKTWYSNTCLNSRCFLLGYTKPQGEADKRKHSEFVFLSQDNLMKEIETQVADYAMSLFLVLESKRMDKSLEKPDKVLLLRSPLDGEIPVDSESRNRKQCIGRMKKYIGDLCLFAGLPQEAIFHYSVANDLLRSVGDSLWISGSMEGLCAASLLCRTEFNKGSSLERPSLQLNVDQLSTAGPVNGVSGDGEESRVGSAIPLTDNEIIEKSEDIFQVYERHKDSKVLGVEARFKYARFYISRKRYREASTALQDVLSTEIALSDAEKIQQYSAMSIMYEDIGFTRKAAFFTRMAALHCTAQHLPLQGWTASYNLLRNALEGYRINFDKNVEEGTTEGWPELQIQIMQELIKMSEELQTPDIPIRHISYLIHAMYKHMEDNHILDLITSLENLAASPKHCSLVDHLILGNGDKLPPVSLTELPVVRGMKVNVLASHLRPFVSPKSPTKTPFIFSTLNKKPGRTKKGNPVVKWVEGEVGEVTMQVLNPMPFDMKVSKMTLLTEGVPFQAFPSCLALSSDGMSHPFMLLGIPEGPGQLQITGYSLEVFGIQSNCAITETILDNPLDLPLMVNVTPRLPLVQFQSSIPEVKSSVNSSHRGSSLFLEVTLYKGQSISGPIIVENVGTIPVENFTITVLTSVKSDHRNIIDVDQNNVMNSLPLEAEKNSHFELGFHGLLHSSHGGDSLKCTGKIKVSYSGGQAWELGMSRQAAIDVKIEVLRSLQCSNFTITPEENGDGLHFELSADLRNQTDHDVEWRYEVKKETRTQDETTSVLPAGETTRATVRLEKFDLSKIANKGSECDDCTRRLLEIVKLHWEIPELGACGVLNLEGLQLNEEMVNVLRKYRLTFEMAVNGAKITRQEVIKTTASSPVLLTVKVYNSSDQQVNSSILNIEPFQVGENGVQVFEVKPKICWIGSTSTILPKIEVGGATEHTCGFLFLCPGQYYINVRCFEKASADTGLSFRGRTQVIKVDSPGYRRSRSSRTESFTDSLLLRQRSFSTPLAMSAYSAVINVAEDPRIEELASCIEEESSSLNEDYKETEDGLSPSGVMGSSENTNNAELEDNSHVKQPCLSAEMKERDVSLAGKESEGEGQSFQPSNKQTMGEGITTLSDETDSNSERRKRESEDTNDCVNKEINEEGNANENICEDMDEQLNEECKEEMNKEIDETNEQNPKEEMNKEIDETNEHNPKEEMNKEIDETNAKTNEEMNEECKEEMNKEIDETNEQNPKEEMNKEIDETNEQNPIEEMNKEIDETNAKTNEEMNEECKEEMNKEIDETNAKTNEEMNEECKEELKEKMNEQSSHEVTSSHTELERSEEDMISTNSNPNDTTEAVRSPSVQQRIMFFNSN